jgi:hypothetical protein
MTNYRRNFRKQGKKIAKEFVAEEYNKNNINKNEQHSNKFDFMPKNTNRKYSNISNDSTSEEFSDKENNINNNNNNNKKPFKSNANDFKVKYKTELCKYWSINGFCKFGDNCAYAHGIENLRSKVTNSEYYRTKNCVSFFEKGFCPYGNRCQFRHGLKTNIVNNPYEKNMSYSKVLKMLSKVENVKNIKKIETRNRLSCFKDLVEDDSSKSILFNDIKELLNNNVNYY